MKNITVSLDDDVYRRVRIKAAELDTSVSALVKKYLVDLAGEEIDFERRKRLQDEILAEIKQRGFSASDRRTRDEVHERRKSARPPQVMLFEDLYAGQDYAGVRVVNPFRPKRTRSRRG